MTHFNLETLPIVKIFWSIMAIEVIGFIGLMFLASRGPRPPDGGLVGAWLVFVPPVFWVLFAIAFRLTQSPSTRAAYAVVLAIPLIACVFGPVLEKAQHILWEHGRRGANYFFWPSQRRLANAIYDHDVTRVKQLIAAAGDLNKPHKKGETLFRFAMTNVDDSDASAEIVRVMLAAGANPNYPPTLPLTFAISAGPRLSKMLLAAGADPNAIDDAQRPVWWAVLYGIDDQHLTTLQMLLDHGADVKKRDGASYRDSGPVGWAAHHKNWRAVWLLIERGADWKDEKDFGNPVHQVVASEVSSLERSQKTVPEAMRKVLAKYEAAETKPTVGDRSAKSARQ